VIEASLILLAFFFGAVSFAEGVAEIHGVDLRAVGSGNAGASNVYRAMGRSAAVLTATMDVLKGFLPVLAGRMAHFAPLPLALVAVAAVLGHCYSPYLGLRGGKGVATSLGAALALTPLPAFFAVIVWIVLISLLRTASIASLVAATVLAGAAAAHPASRPFAPSLLALLAIILLRHADNLRRLSEGQELRFRSAPDAPLPAMVSTDDQDALP